MTGGFARGVGGVIVGAAHLLRHPKLWPLAAAPAAVTLVLYAVLGWLAWRYGASLSTSLTAGDWGWFAWVKSIIGVVVPILAVVVCAAVALVTFTIVATAIASPFLDMLSVRVGRAAGEPEARAVSALRGAARSVADPVRGVVVQLLILVVTFPLNLIPVVGTVAWLTIGAWITAFDYFDFPLARHGYAWRERWRFLRTHRATALGFGIAVFGLMLVPFANLLVLPIAVSGSTLLFARLSADAVSR